MGGRPRVDVVVPTSGRPSLEPLLAALAGFGLGRVIVSEDRDGRGPAWARNAGWRRSDADWVAFLDDDVLPGDGWAAALERDLAGLGERVAASQGRIAVPLPDDRRPTDWERNVRGLEDAVWATADMAFRHAALLEVGGFDERFPRAYREDADLGLRLVDAGWEIVRGERRVTHPVGPADRWVSVRKQRGNADDALMRRRHGRGWRARAGAPRGAFATHAATVATGAAALAPVALPPGARAAGAAAWLGLTARFAWRRIAPGPRTVDEVATMLATSVAIPPAAVWHRALGELRARRLTSATAVELASHGDAETTATPPPGATQPTAVELASHGDAETTAPPTPAGDGATAVESRVALTGASTGVRGRPAAVLLDRDGTLVVDVPYNGDPERVVPVDGARAALDRLRAAGLPLAVVSNQSGVARGLIAREQVDAVNRRVEELLGPIGPWLVCEHGPDDGCPCRKPRPGLVLAAAEALGVPPERCAVIGDIGADVEAARAAGARGVLVPTPVTRPEEVAAAAEVAPGLPAAVELLLEGRP